MHTTPKRPVAKKIGNIEFVDDYDWLQRDTEESLAWMWARDAEASQAAMSSPNYAALKERLGVKPAAMVNRQTPRLINGIWFRVSPGLATEKPAIWISHDAHEAGEILVESAALAMPGEDPEKVNFYWVEMSPDAAFVAIATIYAGAMVGNWRFVEVATGKVLDYTVPAMAYTGALPGWLPDGSGFYLADRVEDGRHRVQFHPIRPGVAPRPVHIFELSDIPANVSGVTIEVSPGARRAIALAGPHERIACAIGELAANQWRGFMPVGHAGECQGVWQGDDCYVARVHDDDHQRGHVVAIPVATSTDAATWTELVPQSHAMLKAAGIYGDYIGLAEVINCSVRFRVVSLKDRTERVVPLPGPGSSMIAMIYRRFHKSDALTFDFSSFVQEQGTFHYDPVSDTLHTLGTPARVLEGIHVAQSHAESIDGTRVPFFTVHRADLDMSRPHPAIVVAYGGFNVALMPMPLAHLEPFIEAGGILVHANLRGGGEFGKQWHDSGRLACKWNVFADLFAVAEHVIEKGMTRPDMLAMQGGSNGGLLAGAAIAHRPDLFRVVIPVVPIFDQLEPLPLDPAFDPVRAIFLEDYGDVCHPVLGKVLASYSPYHNVRQGSAYPAVFSVFGEKDLGCMPFHGRKFTAALRAATISGHPIHLRVWKDVGHGSGTSAEAIEWMAFLMDHLNMTCPPPKP